MITFNCRSPFIVEVNGAANQIASRVAINIYDVTGTTTIASYTLKKTMFSPTQRINYYNISPYCYDVLFGNYQGDNCIKVEVLKFYTDSSNVEHSISDNYYYVTLGFSLYGYSQNDNGFTPVSNYILYRPNQNPITNLIKTEKINYFKNINWDSEGYPNIEFLLETITYKYRLRYYTYSLGELIEQFENLSVTGGVNFYSKLMNNGYSAFNNGNSFEIQISPIAGTTTWTAIFKAELTPICESKYKPLKLQFLNRYGGMQDFYFFKNNNQSIEVKSSNYNTNTFFTYPNINPLIGQTRVYNKNGKHTIKGNTGWISEDYNEFIEDIMLSEWLYLYYEDKGTIWNAAVTLKDSSMQFKTHLNEKVINYELTFEVANSIINNVV
jgi:hypothetical protein